MDKVIMRSVELAELTSLYEFIPELVKKLRVIRDKHSVKFDEYLVVGIVIPHRYYLEDLRGLPYNLELENQIENNFFKKPNFIFYREVFPDCIPDILQNITPDLTNCNITHLHFNGLIAINKAYYKNKKPKTNILKLEKELTKLEKNLNNKYYLRDKKLSEILKQKERVDLIKKELASTINH